MKVKNDYLLIVILVLAIKIFVIFLIPLIAASFLNINRVNNTSTLELWNVWDAPHYLDIANEGYKKVGDQANFIVFLPLYPLLTFLISKIFFISTLLSSYVVSFFCSILLAIVFFKLILIDYSKKIAFRAVFFLFLFPTSFFLHIGYSESLFLLLCVLSIYFARKKNYWLSFIFAGLASFTRLTGLALLIPIFIELYFLNKEKLSRKIYLTIPGMFIAISGFLLYLLLNFLLFGNFLQFSIVEKKHWFTNFSVLGDGLKASYQSLFWRTGIHKIMLGYAQIISFLLGFLFSILVLIKIRLSYGVYMMTILFLSYSMSFWLSMPRYILVLFPMYILFARIESKILGYILFAVSLYLLLLFSIEFVQFGPVF